MPNRTIAKFLIFVILTGVAGVAGGCSHFSQGHRVENEHDGANSTFNPPQRIGTLASSDIQESSGLTVSKCQPNVFWTHNDSGDNAFIFAFAGDGKHLGTWRVTGAENRDWEDMASTGDANGCYLYVGDIGDNGNKLGRGTVYRISEPQITPESAASSRKSPFATAPAEALNFTYDSPHDAETLAVNPKTGDIYVITKRRTGPAAIFKIRPQFGANTIAAERVGEISVPSIPDGLITGGDISPDGTRVALADYVGGYELTLPAGSQNFDEVWKQKPVKFDIGKREIGESIAYGTDGNSIYATSEGGRSPLFEVRRR